MYHGVRRITGGGSSIREISTLKVDKETPTDRQRKVRGRMGIRDK